jgi:hypothetical protein
MTLNTVDIDAIEHAAAEHMRTQYGLLRSDQAAVLGFTQGMVHTRLARGRWVALSPGIYCAAGAPRTNHQVLLAAVWAPQVPALASHRSAAWLWGLMGRAPELPEITIAATKVVRLRGIVVHRSVDLDEMRASERAGIPLTDPFRTLIDLGAVAPSFIVEEAVDRALANHLVTLPGIVSVLASTSRHGVRGAGVLRRVLEARGVQSHLYSPSVLESKMARLLRSLQLPAPVVELVAGAENQYRLDFSWPDIRFTIEVEGFGPHAGLKATGNDRRRANHLIGQGWARLSYGWEDVTRDRHRRAARSQPCTTGNSRFIVHRHGCQPCECTKNG